jgi:acyl carrier protein
MPIAKILTDVNEIFRDVLDDPNIVIVAETTARNVEGWDSLAHIQLVVALEKHFKIRFTSSEIRGFENVGAMCINIQNKVSEA